MTLRYRGFSKYFPISPGFSAFQSESDSIHASSLGFTGLVLLLNFAFSAFANLVVFQHGWLEPITDQTGALLQPGVLVYGVKIALFAAVLFGVGRLSPADVGLKRAALLPAAVITIGVWLFLQGAGAAFQLFQGGELFLSATWAARGLARMAGVQLANLANVFFEETLFRGFLAVQALLLLSGFRGQQPRHKQILIAILLSQVVFALSHLPNRLLLGLSLPSLLADQFQLVGIGSLFTLLYFRSGNLYLVMGIHLLANWPMTLFLEPKEAAALVYGVAILFLIFWKANSPARTSAGE